MTLEDLAGAPFGAGSRLRGARVFHPHGAVLGGDLVVDDARAGELGGLADRPRWPALLRVSRGIGLPDTWPDFLGLALKVPAIDGPGADQDLLFVTCGRTGPLRRVLVPARSYQERPYSSLLPFEVGGRRRLFGATLEVDGSGLVDLTDVEAAALGGALRLTILSGDLLGRRWRRLATMQPAAVLPSADADGLAFDPWHCAAGLRPVGVLNRWRRAAYEHSRRARATHSRATGGAGRR